jgi:rhodanese-related sulfurtransferase
MTPTRITADEVKTRMDHGEEFTFIDTRNPQAWDASEVKLPGAWSVPTEAAEHHLAEIPRDRTIITYCT